MRWVPRWIVKIFGDDRNMFHPDPMPTLRCAGCDRLVTYADESRQEFLHADDASDICKPIGVYRAS